MKVSSLLSVSESAKQASATVLTKQRTQDPFESAGPYGQSKLGEPSPPLPLQLWKAAEIFFVTEVLRSLLSHGFKKEDHEASKMDGARSSSHATVPPATHLHHPLGVSKPALLCTRFAYPEDIEREWKLQHADRIIVMQDNKGEMMEGVEVTDRPLLTEDEQRVLDVYDRLEELQFEIALLKAQGVLSQGKINVNAELHRTYFL